MNLCVSCKVNYKYVTPKGQKSSYCNKCMSKKVAEYQKTEKGKENLKKYQEKYYKTEKGKDSLKKGNRKYQRKLNGFGPGVFEKFLIDQNYSCAICKKKIDESSHADHDHTTGNARGILCPGCNTLLGRIESVGFEWVDKAKAYLKKCEQ